MRNWPEIVLMVLAGAAVLVALGRCLAAAERRGWVRLHGVSKGSAAVAFAAMEDMFSASRSEARQLLEEQKRVGHRAPTPGDGFDDGPSVTGRRYAGRLTVPAQVPVPVPVQASRPDDGRETSGDSVADLPGSSPHVPNRL